MRKCVLFLFMIILLGVTILRSKRIVIDDVLKQSISKTQNIHSFTASSKDFDQYGNKLSEVIEKFDGENWDMELTDSADTSSHWTKVSDALYVLDTNDGTYWKAPYDSKIALTSRIDIRKTFSSLDSSIRKRRIKVEAFGSEPCLVSICDRYRLVDPDDFELNRYIWIDKKTGYLYKEQYLLGNGQTSMTIYSQIDRTEITAPTKIKLISEEADLMTLPGFVKLQH